MKKVNQYEQQAIDFCNKYNVGFSATFIKNGKHFADDKDNRDIYLIMLTRNGKEFDFKFGQSIQNSAKNALEAMRRIKPTRYDVLACLTKYDPNTLEDFCSKFGYDIDRKKAEKIYNAVKEEYKNVLNLFGDIIEELSEIQ
jgi:hypothetical protein